jgi:LSU ribosomal protein L16P
MLQPKRTKFRKQHKGRNNGTAVRGSSVSLVILALNQSSVADLLLVKLNQPVELLPGMSSVAVKYGLESSQTSQLPKNH